MEYKPDYVSRYLSSEAILVRVTDSPLNATISMVQRCKCIRTIFVKIETQRNFFVRDLDIRSSMYQWLIVELRN